MTRPPQPVSSSRAALALGATLVLGGCAGLAPDAGMGVVGAAATAELGASAAKAGTAEQAGEAAARVTTLLARPMTAESVVQVALLNNRGLQAAYNDLGIAEAAKLAASLPPNPRLSLSRLAGGGTVEIERQIAGSILALATLPARREAAEGRFRVAQLRAIEATFRLAADVRRQFYRTVAANQQVGALAQARGTADATSELVKRLGESGGINKLEQAREHALTAEVGAQLARARIQQKVEREKLVRLLGAWGRQAEFKLPAALPPLPSRLQGAREIETLALAKRVDLQIARGELDTVAKELGLTQATRFVNDVDLAVLSRSDRSKTEVVNEQGEPAVEVSRSRGLMVGIEIEIPLFDFGQSKVALAEQTYLRAANRFAEKAVTIRSEARESYLTARGTYDLARFYATRILPLRKIIQDESLLQYSGMLIDVTTLIADARGRILSNAQAIEARRDFWLATVDLRHAVIGGGVAGGPTPGGGEAALAAAPAH